MGTKFLIKEKARTLFNQQGLMNVTLRAVAKALNKSYGNITYHFPNKELLLEQLFMDMHEELLALQKPPANTSLLAYFLQLPAVSFELTLKYLFLTMDIVEIKRNFPKFFAKLNESTQARKVQWMELMKSLVSQAYLKADLEDQELEYIMFLSGSVRTAYFFTTEQKHYQKEQFVATVNLLLKPYLSAKGLSIYQGLASS